VSFGEITSFLKRILKETLEANGMNTISAISYQVINGKNGMPAFGDD
jgi:hypothetical protein